MYSNGRMITGIDAPLKPVCEFNQTFHRSVHRWNPVARKNAQQSSMVEERQEFNNQGQKWSGNRGGRRVVAGRSGFKDRIAGLSKDVAGRQRTQTGKVQAGQAASSGMEGRSDQE